jgi:hypothetical protein
MKHSIAVAGLGLTRKQKETRRGRAELLLAARAAVWNARRENRQLPSLWQWASIRWWTRKKDWTPPQRNMMRKATRHHLARAFLVATVIFALGVVGYEGYGRLQARHLRDQLLNAKSEEVLGVVGQMAGYRRWLESLLQDAQVEAESEGNRSRMMRVSIALLPDPACVDYLQDRLLDAEPAELASSNAPFHWQHRAFAI